ncbi:MAG TPA: NAD(P)/FAD-dependent oxidoreductase [Mesorhizobium sp.]|nr:NAD(P)/FAD-dependent oxidoreductase [Mesorhizobium sp.]
MQDRTEVAIVGAGAAGICLGAKLSSAGVPFIVLEKAEALGGTWRENVYPGSGCDVVSHLYSFSFAQKPDWTRRFAKQAEIQDYLQACAERFGVAEKIVFRANVTAARFDEGSREWMIEIAGGGTLRAKVLVTAVGQLNKPFTPSLPGLASFGGPAFHSAEWDRSAALQGKTVAVIGSGASAVQFVPEIAPTVERLTLFQRSPNWVIPKPDREIASLEAWIYRRLPFALRMLRLRDYWSLERSWSAFVQNTRYGRYWEEMSRKALEEAVSDPELRRALTPDYPAGCKRILLSNDWFRTLARENVRVVPRQAVSIEPSGVIDAAGQRHQADVLIFATGFDAQNFLPGIEITGRAGRSLREYWKPRPRAHRGMGVPGFPNLFMLYGPNTNLGHGSILFMLECQADYILRCLRLMRGRRLATLEPKESEAADYDAALQREMKRTVWVAGCSSWYKSPDGTVLNNWSSHTVKYWWQTRRPRLAEYHLG